MATEFVGIELELMGADGVRRDLESLDRLLNSFRGRKQFNAGFDEARKQVVAYKGELEDLKREQKKHAKGSDDWNNYADKIDKCRQKLWEAQQAVREFGLESRLAGKTFMQTFNSISSKIAHVGSAMQSFGNALTNLTSPFGRLTDGILLGAGYKAFNSFSEGFEKGFNRYDTMKKFPRIMAAFGYSTAESEEAIKALDLSVRGLPTGLDEMVDLTQRFTATTGDLTKGTKLAIATNNAFLASMSTDTQRYQGMMQLQDVLGGKDMNSREWNSLVSSMTPAIVKMGEAMKESGQWSGSIGDFVQAVRDGKIDNQKFVDQLIAIGNEGGVLQAMAQESKNTWQAFFANVGNAASRMTAGVIESMDEVVKSLNLTDKDGVAIDSVNMLLSQKVIPTIDNATASIKSWIKAHPEEIVNFFKELKGIKWGNFVKGFAEGLMAMAKAIQFGAEIMSHFGMRGFGWIMGAGRGIGKTFTVVGGLLKGTRHLWAGLFTLAKFGGRRLGAGGIFGKMASIFGKKKDIAAAGEAAKEIPTVASTFRSAFKSLEGLMKVAGAVTITGFTGFVAFRSVKTMIHDLKGIISELRGMDETDLKVGAGVIGGMTTFFGAMAGLGKVVGKVPAETSLGILKGEAIIGAVVTLASVIADANMWLIQDTFKNFSKAISYFQEGINTLNNIPSLTGADGVKQKISDAITAFNEISELLNGRYVDKGVKEGGFEGISKRKSNAMGYLSTAIRHIQTIAQDLNNLAALEVNANVKTKIDSIKTAVNDIENALPNMLNKISGPKNLSANTEAFANALIGVRRMAYHINRLAGTDVNTGGFASFVAQLKTALASLKDVQGDLELDITVKLAAGFQTSVTKTIERINKAKQQIKTAASKGVRATIPVHITFSVTSNIGAALGMIAGWRNRLRNQGGSSGGGSMQRAQGGYIYRAGGGSVGHPGRPRGSDKIPAWLTAGEYVQNKRAVDTFGIDFMRKVNNLDVKGAMNELMHRAGGMANINRGTSIVNNNYNNQKVVINNGNSAGAGFTFKSASRFVGAF